MSSSTVIVTKRHACQFLKDLVDEVFEKEVEFVGFLRDLSDGNLKILVNNVYYLIHSCKLPLAPLFIRRFTPGEAIESKEMEMLLPFWVGCECLMAIHYPFYDVKNSLIMNIFNAASTRAPNTYQNTLVIPRIICILVNFGSLRYGSLVERLQRAGYSLPFIQAGFDKCMHYGLIDSSHGIKRKDFSNETLVKPSEAARCYITTLMVSPTYLQFVCEDTPMPKEHVVKIHDKYLTQSSYGNKLKRMEGAQKMVRFIEQEEALEREEVLGNRRIDEQSFLFEMSLHDRGGGVCG